MGNKKKPIKKDKKEKKFSDLKKERERDSAGGSDSSGRFSVLRAPLDSEKDEI